MKPLVVAIASDEFIVGAAFYNPPFVKDMDDIGIADGGQSVGNGYRRPCLHQSLQGILHQTLPLGVKG